MDRKLMKLSICATRTKHVARCLKWNVFENV